MKSDEMLYQELIAGNYDQVVTEFEKDETLEASLAILALAYALTRNLSRSLGILNTLQEVDLTGIVKVAYYNAIAINSFGKRENENAMSYANKAQAIDANDYFAVRTQGKVLVAYKKYAKALECFQHLLDTYPESEIVKYDCISVYQMQKNREAALKLNATIKPSLKKYIDRMGILILGDKKSISWILFFWLMLITIPFTRQAVFVLFSIGFLSLIILSIIAKHRSAMFIFLAVGGIMLIIYLINPLLLLDNLLKIVFH